MTCGTACGAGKPGRCSPLVRSPGNGRGAERLSAKDANAKGLTSDSRQPGQYRGHETIARRNPGGVWTGRTGGSKNLDLTNWLNSCSLLKKQNAQI